MPALSRTSRRIAVGSGGPEVYLRGVGPAGPAATVPLLCVHGATFPGHASFDLPLGGVSWLEALAAAGIPAWSVDLPGYGLSERPAAMDRPPTASPPLTDTEEAVAAVRAVRDAILAEAGGTTLSLLGWSWGTTVCASLAAREPERVARLVLFGPQWFHETPFLLAPGSTVLGAYRTVTMAAARARRFRGVPEAERAALVPTPWLDAWEAALLDSDPRARERDPPAIRAPNGTIQDSLDYWCVGEAPYDPTAVRAPTLLAVGEWDRETPPDQARGLFEALDGAPVRRLVVLGRAGHWALLDARRQELLNLVRAFLQEPLDGAAGAAVPAAARAGR